MARTKRNARKKKPTPQNDKQSTPAKPATLKEQGNKAFIARDYELALELFTKAICEDEHNHVLYSNRAAVLMALQEFNKAFSDAERTVQINPTWPKGFYRKGQALEALLRYKEAHYVYEQGLKLAPEDPLLGRALADISTLLREATRTRLELHQAKAVNPDKDKFDRMVKWLKDGGAQFPKLYLQYYADENRGVHSLTKVYKDDVMLFVPYKHIMTSDVAKASDIGKKIIMSGVDLRSQHSFLASYLLQEKKKERSWWDPFIDILPGHFNNMPLFFDEDTLAWLKGSFSLEKIADRIDSLRKEYDNIRRAVPEYNKFRHDEFVWARLVVITRIFGLVIDGIKTDGLVPYADMLNHKRPRETKWTFDNSRYGFIVTSLRTIQRGGQVYDSYGRKCNSRFFVNYGFALENNHDNEATLRIQLATDDSHYATKIRFLGGREINARREYQVPGHFQDRKALEMLSFLRFVNAQNSELMLLSHVDGFKLEAIEAISIRNETAVLEHLERCCEERLSRFETTLKEDQEMLKTLPEYSNERNCVIMRAGEKAVVHFYMELSKRAREYLQVPWKELKREAAKWLQHKGPMQTYMTQTVVPLVRKTTAGR